MAYGAQYRRSRDARPNQLMPDQVSALNAQMPYLTQRLQMQQQKQQRAEDMNLAYKEMAQEKSLADKSRAQAERASQVATGLAATQLGLNSALNPVAHRNLGQVFGWDSNKGGVTDSAVNSMRNYQTTNQISPTSTGDSMFSKIGDFGKGLVSNLNLANTVGAFGTGYGISNIMGDKSNKWLKMGASGLAGGLLGLFTGGGSSAKDNMVSAGIGSIFSGIGSLF